MKRKTLSPSRRLAVWQRDRFTCAYCGATALTDTVALEVDHIVPVAHGGTNDNENLTTSCRACNFKKGPRGQRPPRPAKVKVKKIAAPRTGRVVTCEVCRQIAAYFAEHHHARTDSDLAALFGCTRTHVSHLRARRRCFSYALAKRAAVHFPEVGMIVVRDLVSEAVEPEKVGAA